MPAASEYITLVFKLPHHAVLDARYVLHAIVGPIAPRRISVPRSVASQQRLDYSRQQKSLQVLLLRIRHAATSRCAQARAAGTDCSHR